MNKVQISLLGIYLLFSVGFTWGMDADTFNYLISLYQAKEITKQQLINAYESLPSKEALQAGHIALKNEGISLAVIKEQAQKEQEQFARTFDTLVGLYREGKVTDTQLIKAYELFETDEEKLFGDQLLHNSLSKSIDQLKFEESKHRFQHSRAFRRDIPKEMAMHRSNTAKNIGSPTGNAKHPIAQRATGRRRNRAGGRINPVQEHLNTVWALKRAHQIEDFYRNREEKAARLQKSSPENKEGQSISKQPLKVEFDSPKAVQRSLPESNSSPESLGSLTDLLDQSKAQQEDQAKLRPEFQNQETGEASEDLQTASGDTCEEDSASETANTDDEIVPSSSFSQPTKTPMATPVKKKVRFNLSPESAPSQKDRIAVLRQHGQNQPTLPTATADEESSYDTEELSVHLTSKGTPVFTHGTTVLNPLIESSQFNASIAQTDTEMLTRWGQRLATLLTNDTAREKALKPLIHAFKQPDAPQEKFSLLIRPSAAGFSERARLERLAELS